MGVMLVGVGSLVVAGCPATDSDESQDTTAAATDTRSDGNEATSTLPDSVAFETEDDTATGQDDATTTADALQDVGAPAGTDCTTGASCASGWCAPSAIGSVCVDICVTDCPEDHVCVQADGAGADLVFLCVPLSRPGPGEDATGDSVGREDATPPDATIDNDVIGPDVPLEDTTVVPDGTIVTDATTEPDSIVSDGDEDDDGIPDDEDHIPCMGFFLTIYNEGVTSGAMTLNGVEVVSPNAFPTDAPIVVALNPVQGTNTLAISGKLTGSPSDSLTLVVQDTTGRLWFYVVIIRQPGAPTTNSYTFEIDVDCDALEP